MALAQRQNYIARLTTPEATAKRVESQRVTFATRHETRSSEYWHDRFLLLEQFNSRSVLSIYTFDHLPSLKIYANMANLALIKSSAKNAIIGFCEVKGLYHFYKPMSLDYALRFPSAASAGQARRWTKIQLKSGYL